jgi:HD superfamily phosphohydrolase
LAPFGFLPKSNLDHAFNTIITSFEMYMDTYENGTKKIIDDLYREILLRPADAEAFEYWGSLLESGAMTEADIRTEILNSDEKKWLLLLSKDIKKVEELDDETKKIIDDLYREILLRPADAEAFEYWGSLLESEEITNLELRKAILKSQEAIALKRFNSENTVLVYDVFNMVYEMSGPYYEDGRLFFDPRIDQNEFVKMVEKNKHLLDIEEITVDELRLELEQLKENGIDFLVDDLESVQEQFLDWQKRFVDKTHDFCYNCKWGLPTEH